MNDDDRKFYLRGGSSYAEPTIGGDGDEAEHDIRSVYQAAREWEHRLDYRRALTTGLQTPLWGDGVGNDDTAIIEVKPDGTTLYYTRFDTLAYAAGLMDSIEGTEG